MSTQYSPLHSISESSSFEFIHLCNCIHEVGKPCRNCRKNSGTTKPSQSNPPYFWGPPNSVQGNKCETAKGKEKPGAQMSFMVSPYIEQYSDTSVSLLTRSWDTDRKLLMGGLPFVSKAISNKCCEFNHQNRHQQVNCLSNELTFAISNGSYTDGNQVPSPNTSNKFISPEEKSTNPSETISGLLMHSCAGDSREANEELNSSPKPQNVRSLKRLFESKTTSTKTTTTNLKPPTTVKRLKLIDKFETRAKEAAGDTQNESLLGSGSKDLKDSTGDETIQRRNNINALRSFWQQQEKKPVVQKNTPLTLKQYIKQSETQIGSSFVVSIESSPVPRLDLNPKNKNQGSTPLNSSQRGQPPPSSQDPMSLSFGTQMETFRLSEEYEVREVAKFRTCHCRLKLERRRSAQCRVHSCLFCLNFWNILNYKNNISDWEKISVNSVLKKVETDHLRRVKISSSVIEELRVARRLLKASQPAWWPTQVQLTDRLFCRPPLLQFNVRVFVLSLESKPATSQLRSLDLSGFVLNYYIEEVVDQSEDFCLGGETKLLFCCIPTVSTEKMVSIENVLGYTDFASLHSRCCSLDVCKTWKTVSVLNLSGALYITDTVIEPNSDSTLAEVTITKTAKEPLVKKDFVLQTTTLLTCTEKFDQTVLYLQNNFHEYYSYPKVKIHGLNDDCSTAFCAYESTFISTYDLIRERNLIPKRTCVVSEIHLLPVPHKEMFMFSKPEQLTSFNKPCLTDSYFQTRYSVVVHEHFFCWHLMSFATTCPVCVCEQSLLQWNERLIQTPVNNELLTTDSLYLVMGVSKLYNKFLALEVSWTHTFEQVTESCDKDINQFHQCALVEHLNSKVEADYHLKGLRPYSHEKYQLVVYSRRHELRNNIFFVLNVTQMRHPKAEVVRNFKINPYENVTTTKVDPFCYSNSCSKDCSRDSNSCSKGCSRDNYLEKKEKFWSVCSGDLKLPLTQNKVNIISYNYLSS